MKKKCPVQHAGGQALIEGVMMLKGKHGASAIIKDDKIKVRTYKIRPLADRNRIFRLPFIRGIFSLFDMTYIGMKEMIYSANAASEEEDKESLGKFHIVVSIFLSLLFAIIFFKLFPLGITKLIQNQNIIGDNRFIFNLFDGMIRIGIFVLYIFLISLIPDIKRVFAYHGAEHKVVNCYEHGDKLTVENARKYTTLHTRCGTSFLFIVMIFAILIFSIVPIDLPFFILFMVRLPLLLPIAGVSYEILKLSSKFKENIILRLLILPGLLLQKLTTREPDDKQLEVGIAALKPLINVKSGR